jgi:hypothetical protein
MDFAGSFTMRFLSFVLLLIAFSCPDIHAQPALWFSKDDLPQLQATVQQGPEAEVWQQIRERAEDFCDPTSRHYADPEAVAQRPEREWRVQTLGHYFGRRLTDWMETLGFAYQITGDDRFARHGVLLLDAASRQLPVTDPEIGKGFAGARGDIMRGLAIGHDWLGEAMTPEQKAAWAETSAEYVRHMIAEASRERTWWRPYHNFMGVGMGAAGMLALSLQESYPEEAPDWIAFCADQIDLWFQSGFDARGAYVEGTSYGIYGLSNALRFADALRRTGGRDLMQHPHLQGLPGFYAMSLLPGEPVFDARNNANYSGFGDPTLLLLAKTHQNGLARWVWERAGTGRSTFQILWANQVAPVEPQEAGQPLAQHFEGRGLAIWRTGWDSRDVMFSIEAGPYYPVTHNQADEGHFTLYGLGQRWSIDSGYGNTGLPGGRDQTEAHSCVLIDGQGMARSGAGRGTSGRLVEYHDGPQYGYALADATEAYGRNHNNEPGAMVQWARRHALFIRPSAKVPAYAVILDDIRKDDQVREYTWMMHTPAAMQIRFPDEGQAQLLPDSARLVTWVETPADAAGRGSAIWTFSVTEPGEYEFWGRARAAGAVTAQSDSFFVQVNDHPRFDWHSPSRRDWTWGPIGAGVGSEPVRYHLEPGEHTLRFFTREPAAQLERVTITAANTDQQPPFVQSPDHLRLLAEDARLTSPMQLVRREPASDAPRMSLHLTASTPLQHQVTRYDGHQRIEFQATTVQPDFAALLLPLPGDVAGPEIEMQRDDHQQTLRIRWSNRLDQITWPLEHPRRPTVTITKANHKP